MKFIFEKNLRIIADLLAYCHNHGCKHYQVDISFEKGLSVYEIRAAMENYTPAEMDELNTLLSTPRQHEVEESFWCLSGDIDADPELELIGMMIDRGEASFSDGWLEIRVERKEDR